MTFFSVALLFVVFFASANLAFPLKGSCDNGAFTCVSNVVYQCNLGCWELLNDCSSQNLECNADFECDFPTSTPTVTALGSPMPTFPPGLGASCENGSFTCVGNVVYQCNFDAWIVNDNCEIQGLQCNEDYECAFPTESTPLELPEPSFTPTLGGSCENGSFTCVNNVVFQCNFDSWILNNDCGSQNLVCSADFECVFADSQLLNAPAPEETPCTCPDNTEDNSGTDSTGDV